MKTLGIVAVAGIAALVLIGCQEGPAAPKRDEIEGAWMVLSLVVLRGGEETMIPFPAGYEGRIELDEGEFVLRDREAGRPWRRTLGTYVIDVESSNVIASITFNNGVPVNRVMIIRYELDGASRATFWATYDDNLGTTAVYEVERISN